MSIDKTYTMVIQIDKHLNSEEAGEIAAALSRGQMDALKRWDRRHCSDINNLSTTTRLDFRKNVYNTPMMKLKIEKVKLLTVLLLRIVI